MEQEHRRLAEKAAQQFVGHPAPPPENSRRHAAGWKACARRDGQHIDANDSGCQEPERQFLEVGEPPLNAAVPSGEVISARHERDHARTGTNCGPDGPAPEAVVIDAASANTGRRHGKVGRTAAGEVDSIAVPYDEHACNEKNKIT